MATILLSDDELELRVTLAKHLQRAGHQVFTASNGNEALAVMRHAAANLVITDMPEKGDLETITELRREFPELPVIAISRGGILDPTNYLPLARKLGADRTFAKPFSSSTCSSPYGSFLVNDSVTCRTTASSPHSRSGPSGRVAMR